MTTTEQQTLIEQISTILQQDLGMRDYQATEFQQDLAKPNFYEFWFGGTGNGSLKVYISRGVPYVVDQYNVTKLKTPVTEANEKIKALFN